MTAHTLEEVAALSMCAGQGKLETGALCVMQMADYMTTGGTSDRPVCVSLVIRRLAIRLNDRIVGEEQRRAMLWPLLPEMLNTKTTTADDVLLAMRVFPLPTQDGPR